jgi:hypothetical protein
MAQKREDTCIARSLNVSATSSLSSCPILIKDFALQNQRFFYQKYQKRTSKYSFTCAILFLAHPQNSLIDVQHNLDPIKGII